MMAKIRNTTGFKNILYIIFENAKAANNHSNIPVESKQKAANN
jgi:hypothetical protein